MKQGKDKDPISREQLKSLTQPELASLLRDENANALQDDAMAYVNDVFRSDTTNTMVEVFTSDEGAVEDITYPPQAYVGGGKTKLMEFHAAWKSAKAKCRQKLARLLRDRTSVWGERVQLLQKHADWLKDLLNRANGREELALLYDYAGACGNFNEMARQRKRARRRGATAMQASRDVAALGETNPLLKKTIAHIKEWNRKRDLAHVADYEGLKPRSKAPDKRPGTDGAASTGGPKAETLIVSGGTGGRLDQKHTGQLPPPDAVERSLPSDDELIRRSKAKRMESTDKEMFFDQAHPVTRRHSIGDEVAEVVNHVIEMKGTKDDLIGGLSAWAERRIAE